MTGKQDAEMMGLAKALRRAAQTAQNDDLSAPLSEKRDRHVERIEIIFKAAQRLEESSAPSPHPRGEPVAWPKLIETAPKDGTEFIAHQDGEVYRCCWRIEEPDEGPGRAGWYDFFNESFEDPTEWSPLRYAAPPPAGADAVRETARLAFVAGYWLWFGPANKHELEHGMADIEHGWTEYAAEHFPAPQPQEKPTGDRT